MGTIITVIVVLIIVGVLLYLVNTVIPMPHWVKQVINALVALFVFLWILEVFGVIHLGLNSNPPVIRH